MILESGELKNRSNLIVAAWVIMLSGSLLPDIFLFQLTGIVPSQLLWVKLVFLGSVMALSLLVRSIRRLFPFTAVLLTYTAAAEFLNRFSFDIPLIQTLFGNNLFIQALQPVQFGKLAVTLIVFLVLLLLGYNRAQMFLVKGNLKAPITPVKWLGFSKPDSWVSFGGQYSVYLALGTGVALWLTSRTPLNQFADVVPVLPSILFMAVLNAFNEEFIYRSSILATLEKEIGKKHVWWISATFFGIAHFWGVPYGLIGVVLATFMGWILAKAMLETRGFFWSWWIHFLQDVAIFSFIALGAVTPGG